MTNPATAAGVLATRKTPPGATLVSVNGVAFGDPAHHPQYPSMLLGRGLAIEGGFHRTPVNGQTLVHVTVWMGSYMVTLTLNHTDLVVLGSTAANQ